MPTKLSRSELRAWFRIAGGMRSLLKSLDRQLRDCAGMTHDDYEILSRLYREPAAALRMSDLARDVGFSPSRLSHAMTRMEDSGWVTRQPSSKDRRSTEATLTPLGSKVVEAASVEHLALVRKLIFDTLGADRAREVADAMDEIGRAAREG